MPKRKLENDKEEESIETGNVDQGDFSDGDSDEDKDGNEEKMEKKSDEEDSDSGIVKNFLTYLFNQTFFD